MFNAPRGIADLLFGGCTYLYIAIIRTVVRNRRDPRRCSPPTPSESLDKCNVTGDDKRLHPLKGDLKGFWSVKVTGNWRVIFRFDEEPRDVDLVDYH